MSMQEAGVEAPVKTIIRVRIPKAAIEMDVYPDDVPMLNYEDIWRKGCQMVLCKNMTKLTKASYPDPEELQAKALEVAQQNLEDLYAGRITVRGAAKETKASSEVMKEARRIAKDIVRQQLKAAGYKISFVDSKDITRAANSLLATDPTVIEDAKKEVERIASRKTVDIDLSFIKPSETKRAAAAKRKDEAALSASQAGRVTARARPAPNA